MNKFLIAAAAALLANSASARTTLPAQPPKLVVVISIDQFSADLWDQYRPQFRGGLARLASGAVFHNGFQSHAATETCPGHSTILTGDRPATTGIVANAWLDQSLARSDKSVYCAEDEEAPGSSSSVYKVSDRHLRVPTLGDRMKAIWPSSRNVAVAGKDRAAVMMSGHHPDQRWYWDGKKFATDLKGIEVPPVIGPTNDAVKKMVAGSFGPLDPPPFCAARGQRVTLPGGKVIGNGRLARAAGDASSFRASPEFDASVLALAAHLIEDMKLGQGKTPDLISVGLSATDYVGHTYGPGGQEMCLQLLEVDRDLGNFFDVLDRSGIDYAVALTADHGGLDVPERLKARGYRDAAWVDPALSAAAVGKKIGAKLGLSGPVLIGDVSGDISIDRAIEGSDRSRVLSEALKSYRMHPEVAAAFSKAQIARMPMPSGDPVKWTLIQRERASFDAKRSGDIVVFLKPHIMPITDTSRYVSTHGSPWDYDRRVPIVFWRKGIVPSNGEQHVETADIMPTLAAMLGLRLSEPYVDGKCLRIVAGASCLVR